MIYYDQLCKLLLDYLEQEGTLHGVKNISLALASVLIDKEAEEERNKKEKKDATL